MADELKIQVIVDGSQVTAGMGNVTSAVDAATARIQAAFGSVANAPDGIRTALAALQNNAQLTTRGVQALSGALNQMIDEAGSATTQMSSMERAMAMATGRLAGFTLGAGMVGGALGRVAAASSVLGPLLAVAFPVFAAIALVDILAKGYE